MTSPIGVTRPLVQHNVGEPLMRIPVLLVEYCTWKLLFSVTWVPTDIDRIGKDLIVAVFGNFVALGVKYNCARVIINGSMTNRVAVLLTCLVWLLYVLLLCYDVQNC